MMMMVMMMRKRKKVVVAVVEKKKKKKTVRLRGSSPGTGGEGRVSAWFGERRFLWSADAGARPLFFDFFPGLLWF